MFTKSKAGGKLSKYRLATFLAILLHAVGLVGLLGINETLFLQATPLNLLGMFLLLLWTQVDRNRRFVIFLVICFLVGMGIEILGVQTGVFFGRYSYGSLLGPKLWGTPLILGINWFSVVYCCGICSHWLVQWASRGDKPRNSRTGQKVVAIATILMGALLTVVYDWIMEPVATKLHFWTWHDGGQIPTYNYVCWFIFSLLLLTLFQFSKFDKQNRFAVRLIIIQVLFFLLLRYFEN